MRQPPPRGCVLKLWPNIRNRLIALQPPPRGCVLKLYSQHLLVLQTQQPPPRGCVLKHGCSIIARTITTGSRLRAAVC